MARYWFSRVAGLAALVTLLPLVLPVLSFYEQTDLGAASATHWYGASLRLLSLICLVAVFVAAGINLTGSGQDSNRHAKRLLFASVSVTALMTWSMLTVSEGLINFMPLCAFSAWAVVQIFVLSDELRRKRLWLTMLLALFFSIPTLVTATVLHLFETHGSIMAISLSAGGFMASMAIIGYLVDRLIDPKETVETFDDGAAEALHGKP